MVWLSCREQISTIRPTAVSFAYPMYIPVLRGGSTQLIKDAKTIARSAAPALCQSPKGQSKPQELYSSQLDLFRLSLSAPQPDPERQESKPRIWGNENDSSPGKGSSGTESDSKKHSEQSCRDKRNEAVREYDRPKELRWTAELATLLYHQGKRKRETHGIEFRRIRALYINIERRLLPTDWKEYLQTFCKHYDRPISMSIMVEFDKHDGDKKDALILEEERRNRLEMCECCKLGDGALEKTKIQSLTLRHRDIMDLTKSIGAHLVIYLKVYDGHLLTWVLEGATGELLHTVKKERLSAIQSLISEASFAKDRSLEKNAQEKARRALNTLSRIILDPIAKYFKRDGASNSDDCRLVYFMPCSTLSPIPFSALKVHKKYLIENFTVAQSTSLMATVRLQNIGKVIMHKQSGSEALKGNVVNSLTRGIYTAQLPASGTRREEDNGKALRQLYGTLANPAERSDLERPKLLILNAAFTKTKFGPHQGREIEKMVSTSFAAGCPCVLASKWQVPQEKLDTILVRFLVKLVTEDMPVSKAWYGALKSLADEKRLDYDRDFCIWSSLLPHGFSEMQMNSAQNVENRLLDIAIPTNGV